ncbi:MAG: hypothetical protein JSW55_18210, partial [Chloroflexota bacterium]
QGTSVARFEPAETVLLPGDTLRVVVSIDAATGVYGAEVMLSFNANVVTVVDGDPAAAGVQLLPGDFLASDSRFEVANQADNEAGTALYAATLLAPAEPATGEGELFSFDLLAIAAGDAALSWSNVVLASDEGMALPLTLGEAQISVGGELGTATVLPPQTPAATASPTPAATIPVPSPTPTESAPAAEATAAPTVTPAGPMATVQDSALTATDAPGQLASSTPGQIEPTATATAGSAAAETPVASSASATPAVLAAQNPTEPPRAPGPGSDSPAEATSPAVDVIGQDATPAEDVAADAAQPDPDGVGPSVLLLVLILAALLLFGVAIYFYIRAYRQR